MMRWNQAGALVFWDARIGWAGGRVASASLVLFSVCDGVKFKTLAHN